MKIRRKLPLTLIEVCIAFGLVSIISFVLFSTFKNTTKMNIKVEKIKPYVIQRKNVYQRLIQVFSHACTDTISISDGELQFSFNNGLDRELIYSGLVKGALFVNKDSELVLSIWGKDSVRDEILLKGVKSADWDLSTPGVLLVNVEEEKTAQNIAYSFFLPRVSEDGYQLLMEVKEEVE